MQRHRYDWQKTIIIWEVHYCLNLVSGPRHYTKTACKYLTDRTEIVYLWPSCQNPWEQVDPTRLQLLHTQTRRRAVVGLALRQTPFSCDVCKSSDYLVVQPHLFGKRLKSRASHLYCSILLQFVQSCHMTRADRWVVLSRGTSRNCLLAKMSTWSKIAYNVLIYLFICQWMHHSWVPGVGSKTTLDDMGALECTGFKISLAAFFFTDKILTITGSVNISTKPITNSILTSPQIQRKYLYSKN